LSHPLSDKFSDVFGITKYSEKVRKLIFNAYDFDYRHYHNLDHIEYCLGKLAGYLPAISYPKELEFAIWFHDLIYMPGRKDNEQQSAMIAYGAAILLDRPKVFAERVKRLIECTETHQPFSGDDELYIDSRVIIDVDMGILSEDPVTYDNYAVCIERECLPVVGRAAFRAGRKNWLQKTLDSERIYFIDGIFDEMQARENLKREYESLQGNR
jgi:predicted metal-dependent HD superfamily phosphohydrolase